MLFHSETLLKRGEEQAVHDMTYDEAWKYENPQLRKQWISSRNKFNPCKESRENNQKGNILSQEEDAL